MKSSRRDFIKFVVAGSMAAGCPLDLSLLTAPREIKPEVDGEENAICHQVRDGYTFARPPASKRHDIVIVGGGVSGLTAAYISRQRDFLLLEKEAHWGGNAYLEEYEGQAFATGAAFEVTGSVAEAFSKEIGLELLPVNNFDGTLVHGEFIPDTWRAGLDHLPYSPDVRESFKKFRQALLAIPVKDRHRELDNQPFADFCRGYAPEVKHWWDTYGPSNWGARTEETSAMIGIAEMQAIGDENKQDNRLAPPGGLGAITKRLAEILEPHHRERMLTGATIIAVEQEKHQARVTYVHQGQLKAVAARAVIMATPKFITWRLIAGLRNEQREAMKRIRYIPYPVVNLIFDKPVFNRGYDNWCPGNTFTDFVVADWTVRNEPGYRRKYNILTCYTPLTEAQRGLLLTEEGTRQFAANVLRDFQNLFPGSDVDPVEVHIYRRGHPLYMSVPGNFTQVQPLVRHPMERIFFANTDSEGPVSATSDGIAAARRAVKEAERLLAEKPQG